MSTDEPITAVVEESPVDEETSNDKVLLDAHNVSHAFCTQLKDVQWYCRRRVPGQYRLLQPWECYKAVLSADNLTVAYLHLLCPTGSDIVIGKDEMRMQGISYWVRVSHAVIKRIAVIQAKRGEDGRDNYELNSLDSFETKKCTYTPGQVLKWPDENGKEFSYSTRRPYAEGLLVQPTLNEATKVGETISTHTPDFRILQQSQNPQMYVSHPRMPVYFPTQDGGMYFPEMMGTMAPPLQPTLPVRTAPPQSKEPQIDPPVSFADAVKRSEEKKQ